ncbi:hypothetical protein [Qipengyuania zhejiangensis]|uniref:hypothetical protein n=1 Tax=Qipengyuania zhejiangensis TaxID=3077782 RepID=UPI002D796E95|nr:hypothetical protein [Qipengyuania sp. Z2]
MSGGVVAIVIVSILVWGCVQIARLAARSASTGTGETSGHLAQRKEELEREVGDLQERIKVLERIATEGNSLDARETQRIAAEIEALRDKQAD